MTEANRNVPPSELRGIAIVLQILMLVRIAVVTSINALQRDVADRSLGSICVGQAWCLVDVPQDIPLKILMAHAAPAWIESGTKKAGNP